MYERALCLGQSRPFFANNSGQHSRYKTGAQLGAKNIKRLALPAKYEGWNFNSGNYLFTTDTK